nr:MAG TPA: hypothetical protein [Caudoviricetes sp.]
MSAATSERTALRTKTSSSVSSSKMNRSGIKESSL